MTNRLPRKAVKIACRTEVTADISGLEEESERAASRSKQCSRLWDTSRSNNLENTYIKDYLGPDREAFAHCHGPPQTGSGTRLEQQVAVGEPDGVAEANQLQELGQLREARQGSGVA